MIGSQPSRSHQLGKEKEWQERRTRRRERKKEMRKDINKESRQREAGGRRKRNREDKTENIGSRS